MIFEGNITALLLKGMDTELMWHDVVAVGDGTQICRSSEFRCLGSGHCIPSERHCNGEADCSDGSDEQGCTVGTSPHTSYCLQV